MARALLLAAVVLPSSGPVCGAPSVDRFEAEVRVLEVRARGHAPSLDGGVAFVGGSTFTRWTDLEQIFRGFEAVNLGFGGGLSPPPPKHGPSLSRGTTTVSKERPPMSAQPCLEPGAFSWIDLMTSDMAAATAFYGALMGWTAREVSLGADATYTMLMLGDRPAAGMVPIPREMRGAHPCWMSHVRVADLEASVERAKSLGGQLCKVGEAGDKGRFAVFADPTGAIVDLWQPTGVPGDMVYNQVGGLTWNELMTTDMEKAEAFYTGLFGWVAKPQGTSHPYTVFENEGRARAGMMTLPDDAVKRGAPPHWAVYLGVDDTDAAVAKAVSLGAEVLCPPTDIADVGRFSVLADPQGAVFAVIKVHYPT